MHIPHFAYLVLHGQTFGCFHLLATTNCAALLVQVFEYLGTHLGVELLSQMVSLCLTF